MYTWGHTHQQKQTKPHTSLITGPLPINRTTSKIGKRSKGKINYTQYEFDNGL